MNPLEAAPKRAEEAKVILERKSSK